jgi:two-component system LytT family sensor kinase
MISLTAIAGVWSVVAWLTVLDDWASAHARGSPAPSWRDLAPGLSEWYLWALLTPGILWLGGRLPVIGPGSRNNWALHIPAIIAAILLHAVVYSAAYVFVAHGVLGAPFVVYAWRVAISFMPFGVIVYAAILTAGVAATVLSQSRADAVRTAQLAAQLARAEASALRTHLHPHFLFNALHTVGSLVRERQHDAAVEVIVELSTLLRDLSRQGAPEETPLDEELAFVRRYLAVEQVRFEDRLRVTWHVAPEAQQAWVPRLLLQPLVENAIRHGIAASAAAGRVDIVAMRAGDTLEVSVRDDGPGPADQLPDAVSDSPGVGLATTRARLALTYGPEATLVLERAPGGGAIVTARLPYHSGPLDDAPPEIGS